MMDESMMMDSFGTPSITGGAAGQSGATSSGGNNYINATSGNAGAWLFISIAAIIGVVLWKKKK